jgi:hypothetical protein
LHFSKPETSSIKDTAAGVKTLNFTTHIRPLLCFRCTGKPLEDAGRQYFIMYYSKMPPTPKTLTIITTVQPDLA